MAASNFKRNTFSASIPSNNKVKRIHRRRGLMALSAAASAVALFGMGKFAKADVKTFEYNYNFPLGQNVPNTGNFVWSGNLAGTFWYDLNSNTGNVSGPGAADIAQFDSFFGNMNPSGFGGPPLESGNVLLTLAAGQTNFGGLNILSPGLTPQWVSAAGVTAAFAMVIGGTDTTSFLQIGSGGINVAGSGSFVGTDTSITVPITLGAAQTWSVIKIPVTLTTAVTNGTTNGVVTNSTGLTVSGGINLNGLGANALVINGGGSVNLTGNIVDGASASGISVADSTVTFASNSFTGGLTVGSGALVATGSGNGLGGNGNLITMNGGTIEATGSAGAGLRNLNNFSVDGSGVSVNGTGSDTTWNGVPLNINVNSANNTFTINQNLVGSLFINQTGGGTIILGRATNSYTGGTSIGAGSILTIQDFAALGSGTLSNVGTLNVLSSVNLSGATDRKSVV